MYNLRANLKSILKNPFTDYLRFLINWWKNNLKSNLLHNNFHQGYLSLVINSKIEHNVNIGNRVLVLDSYIDSFTYIFDETVVSKAFIGKFCSIGQNCKFRLGIHPSRDFVSTHPIFFSTKKQVGKTFADQDYFEEEKVIHIGNDVWIGANVIILDGITIGDGAIIGAGAVVTKDVPPYSIYGGVPAKLIRYRFDQKTIDWLVNFQWWNKDEKWLKTNFKDFHNIDEFVQKYAQEEGQEFMDKEYCQ